MILTTITIFALVLALIPTFMFYFVLPVLMGVTGAYITYILYVKWWEERRYDVLEEGDGWQSDY